MNKEILRLAIPNILSNISIPLLSTVDTALMGRLSEVHLGAVGIGAMIFNFIYWNFSFLRMGTTGMTAQAYGRSDARDISLTLGRALLVAWAIALLILLLRWPLGQAGYWLMQVGSDALPLVQTYFEVRLWAAPASLPLLVLLGWFFGMQNAIYPLLLTLIINATNIAANFLLVRHYGMGVDGVAWGTVIAQYVGLFSAFALLAYRYPHHLRSIRWAPLLEWQALRQFLRVNRDIFIRTVGLTFVFGFFYSRSSSAGETLLAVNVILLQFLNWMSYAVDGFAYATESLVGKYAGRADRQLLHRSIRLSFAWGMGLALVFSLLYALAGESLLYVFTDQASLIQASLPYLFWMALFPLLSTPCYLWDGVYIGLTASGPMRDSMLGSIALFLVAYGLLSFTKLGNHGLWLILLLFMMARGGIQWWMYRRGKITLPGLPA
ncbi:MAG: MATE family efflux transporter [Bacteroidota bacterium]